MAHLFAKNGKSEDDLDEDSDSFDFDSPKSQEEAQTNGKSDFFVTSLVDGGKSTLQIVETFQDNY